MEAENNKHTTDVDNFIQNPSRFKLFRGENMGNKGGVYFTLDENWAKKFGDNIIRGYLPKGAKIKRLMLKDLNKAFFDEGLVLDWWQ